MTVIATSTCIRSAKALSKKYRSFNADYKKLVDSLTENPRLGVDLGGGYRKVRMAITSKGKGKSGGCRVITLNMIERNGSLYLLYAYDKSSCDNIDIAVIKAMVAELGL